MKGNVLTWMCCVFFPLQVYSWNAVGHRMIAHIAVNHLTPGASIRFNAYNHVLDKPGRPQTLVSSAVWLDTFYRRGSRSWDSMHYLDFPFSVDGSPLPRPQQMNALLAIQEAQHLLLNPQASLRTRALALRILLHVVGDLHQPLHAVTRISMELPKGDRGGNLVPLRGKWA